MRRRLWGSFVTRARHVLGTDVACLHAPAHQACSARFETCLAAGASKHATRQTILYMRSRRGLYARGQMLSIHIYHFCQTCLPPLVAFAWARYLAGMNASTPRPL